jgi:hypothetical protein
LIALYLELLLAVLVMALEALLVNVLEKVVRLASRINLEST